MEYIVGCVYCGVSRFVSMSEYCYTDVSAYSLKTPESPAELGRKHYWIETLTQEDGPFGIGEI